MAQTTGGRSPVGFGIFDLLTRVVPGATIVGSFILIENPSLFENPSTLVLLFIGLASYLFGEALNLLRLVFYPVPRTFTRLVYEQSRGQTQTNLVDRWRDRMPYITKEESKLSTDTQDNFWQNLSEDMGVGRFRQIEDIYFVFLNHSEPRFSRRMERLLAIYHFTINMALASFGSIVLATYALLTKIVDPVGPVVVLTVVLIFLYSIFVSFYAVEKTWVNNLLRFYFTDLASRGRNPHSARS